MSDLPAFDEVHVISDIHMGGKPGFQILRETNRLANFIRWVAKQRPDGRVALILNGDVFDTLAEDIRGYVAVDEAEATVQRIMNDASFAQIWDALAEFALKEGRTLVIIIGNHDIEVAFPPVQRLILSRLAGDNLPARARIEFSTAGAGYTCTVGDARIYCIHGNEVDPWNYNRYEDLAKVARRLNAGQSLEQSEWTPNAGTKMVKEVMNDVKRTYRWIDLLKPETSAAVGALVVLDPSQASKISDLVGIVGRLAQSSGQVDQRLSAEGFHRPVEMTTAAGVADQLLGPNLRQGLQLGAPGATAQDADAMLRTADESLKRPGAPASESDETLGTPQLVWDRLTLLGIAPSDLADDAMFLRRVYLDTIGTLPTAEEARAFLTSKEPTKRAKLIDALLERPEFPRSTSSSPVIPTSSVPSTWVAAAIISTAAPGFDYSGSRMRCSRTRHHFTRYMKS